MTKQELMAAIEQQDSAILAAEKALTHDVEQLVTCHFKLDAGTVIRGPFIRPSLRGPYEIFFEIGFWNTLENRVDFGSDVSAYIEQIAAGSEWYSLRLNHGTIGCYSKSDIYQIKRICLLNHIWNNVDEIETEFNNLLTSPKAMELKEMKEKVYKLEGQLSEIITEEKHQELLDIENSLCSNQTYEEVKPHWDAFLKCRISTIDRITKKSVITTDHRHYNKREFAQKIQSGKIVLKTNGKAEGGAI